MNIQNPQSTKPQHAHHRPPIIFPHAHTSTTHCTSGNELHLLMRERQKLKKEVLRQSIRNNSLRKKYDEQHNSNKIKISLIKTSIKKTLDEYKQYESQMTQIRQEADTLGL